MMKRTSQSVMCRIASKRNDVVRAGDTRRRNEMLIHGVGKSQHLYQQKTNKAKTRFEVKIMGSDQHRQS